MKNFFKLFAVAIIGIAIFGSAFSVSALTEQEKQVLIAQIQQQITLLTQQLQQMLAQQNSWCYTFNTSLGVNQSGNADVAQLHNALVAEGISFAPDTGTIYSNGTIQGVKIFQAKYGIAQTGFFGVISRGQMNELHGCTNNNNNNNNNNQSCTPNWQCVNWGTCSSGIQTRTCTDYNNCGTTNLRPNLSQSCNSGDTTTTNTNNCQATCVTQTDGTYAVNCSGYPTKCSAGQACKQTFTITNTYNSTTHTVSTIRTLSGSQCYTPCTPTWSCTAYGACVNGSQARTCTDSHNCGDITNKPAVTQTCTVAVCTPTWTCGNWTACANGNQTRTCTDSNNCGVTTGKPAIAQTCAPATCVPNWQCANWSDCFNSQQTRTCTDSNSCGVDTGKPSQAQSCSSTVSCIPNWQCSVWSSCANSNRTRTCTDQNSCGLASRSPATSETCSTTCTPAWVCSGWSLTTADFRQTRTCTDTNACGVTMDKPEEVQHIYSCWDCTGWSTCLNHLTTRTCRQNSACGTSAGAMPLTSQACYAENCQNAVWDCSPILSQCRNGVREQYCSDHNLCFKTITTPCNQTAPTVDIQANNSNGPLSIASGSSAVLTWRTTNADTCLATDDWAGPKLVNDTLWGQKIIDYYQNTLHQTYNPYDSMSTLPITGTKKFTLSCTNSLGTTKDSVIINASTGASVNIMAKQADDPNTQPSEGPITIMNGSKATLSWTASNVTSCTGSGDWSGFKLIAGGVGAENTASLIVSGNAIVPKTYTITCVGTNGATVSDSVTVNVNFLPYLATADLKINGSDGPVAIPTGQSMVISWSSTQSRECWTLYNAGGNSLTWDYVGLADQVGYKIVPAKVGKYVLRCAGGSPDLQGEDSVTVGNITLSSTISSTAKAGLRGSSVNGYCPTGRDCVFYINLGVSGSGLTGASYKTDVDILNGTTVVANACKDVDAKLDYNILGSCKWKIPQNIPLNAPLNPNPGPTTDTDQAVPMKQYYASFHLGSIEYARIPLTIFADLYIKPNVASLSCSNVVNNTCTLNWKAYGSVGNYLDQSRARLFIKSLTGTTTYAIPLCDAGTNYAQYCTFHIPSTVAPGTYNITFNDVVTDYLYTSVPLTVTQ